MYKAHENESLIDFVQKKNNKLPMAYICRYKLVKKICYELVPVTWLPGEEEARNAGEMTDTDAYTDTEGYASEATEALDTSLNDYLDALALSYSGDGNDELNGKFNDKSCLNSKVVTPIKIVKNSVQKVTRAHNQMSPNKRASPDAGNDNEDVSPSKRTKSGYNSPGARGGKYKSPAQNKMQQVKRNLNDSLGAPEDPSSPYESKSNPDTLKITIRKKPLVEKNDNDTLSPLNKTLFKPIDSASTRRSILKDPSTPRSE